MLVSLMFNRLGLNSQNSSKPPSTDPNRKRKSRGKGLKRDGQKGHVGTTLKQVGEISKTCALTEAAYQLGWIIPM